MHRQPGDTVYCEVNIKMPNERVLECNRKQFTSGQKISDIISWLKSEFDILAVFKLLRQDGEVNEEDSIAELMNEVEIKMYDKIWKYHRCLEFTLVQYFNVRTTVRIVNDEWELVEEPKEFTHVNATISDSVKKYTTESENSTISGLIKSEKAEYEFHSFTVKTLKKGGKYLKRETDDIMKAALGSGLCTYGLVPMTVIIEYNFKHRPTDAEAGTEQ